MDLTVQGSRAFRAFVALPPTKQISRLRDRLIVTTHRKARAGELEALYRSRYSDFLRVAIAISGSASAATDAVQDGFARALASLPSYRGDAPLSAWVWRIVVNAALSQRAAPVAGVDVFEQATLNGADLDAFTVRSWIAALPERQRLAVFLRYYADLDYRGIAVALGIEVGTVSATLNAAHAALRASLKEVIR